MKLKMTAQPFKINTIFAIVTKFIFIFPAVFGQSNLVMEMFSDAGVTIFIILNSLRLLNYK